MYYQKKSIFEYVIQKSSFSITSISKYSSTKSFKKFCCKHCRENFEISANTDKKIKFSVKNRFVHYPRTASPGTASPQPLLSPCRSRALRVMASPCFPRPPARSALGPRDPGEDQRAPSGPLGDPRGPSGPWGPRVHGTPDCYARCYCCWRWCCWFYCCWR